MFPEVSCAQLVLAISLLAMYIEDDIQRVMEFTRTAAVLMASQMMTPGGDSLSEPCGSHAILAPKNFAREG